MGLISWIKAKLAKRKKEKEDRLRAILEVQREILEGDMYGRRSKPSNYTNHIPPKMAPTRHEHTDNPIIDRHTPRSWRDNDSSIHHMDYDSPASPYAPHHPAAHSHHSIDFSSPSHSNHSHSDHSSHSYDSSSSHSDSSSSSDSGGCDSGGGDSGSGGD